MLLEETTNDGAAEAECFWGEMMRFWGHPLTNDIRMLGVGGHFVKRAEWTEETLGMLGKVSDARIARILGVSRRCVTYHRETLGIAAHRAVKVHAPAEGVPAVEERMESIRHRLGKEPDYKLADEIGVSKTWVMKRRRALGIRSFGETTGFPGRFSPGGESIRSYWARVRSGELPPHPGKKGRRGDA